jgi:hypothetical protein
MMKWTADAGDEKAKRCDKEKYISREVKSKIGHEGGNGERAW